MEKGLPNELKTLLEGFKKGEFLDALNAQKKAGFINEKDGWQYVDDYYITEGELKKREAAIRNFELAKVIGLNCAPKLVEVVKDAENENGRCLIVLQVPGAPFSSLRPFSEAAPELSFMERLMMFNEFLAMLGNSIINRNAVEDVESWYVTPENKLVVLDWNCLDFFSPQVEVKRVRAKVKSLLRLEKEDEVFFDDDDGGACGKDLQENGFEYEDDEIDG
ncbi:MAG: hypothetical protein LBU32_23465 [Clostridiales bacterium]|jgi:hypothetical protein|nr:hypothetical protein [Clostridiales bacterium]